MPLGEHNARKTHCKHGHEYTPENTYVQPKGSRACRTCLKESQRRGAQRRRVEMGLPDPVPLPPWPERYVVDENGCWIWTGYVDPKTGYGMRSRPKGQGSRLAHRQFFELHVGPIPEGLVIDHLCRVRACVNPGHLEAVTQRENLLRGVGLSATKTGIVACPNGHPYMDGSFYVDRGGSRRCRECARANKERYRERNP